MCRTCALIISIHHSIFSGRTRRHAGSGHIQDVTTRAFQNAASGLIQVVTLRAIQGVTLRAVRARRIVGVSGTDIAIRVLASWRKQSDDSQDRPRTYIFISIYSTSLCQITDVTLLQLEGDQR